MWAIEYSNEAKFYFIDNGELVFHLLVKIEELKFTKDGIPPEGCTQLDDLRYWWEVAEHHVIYRRIVERRQLRILIVKPIE